MHVCRCVYIYVHMGISPASQAPADIPALVDMAEYICAWLHIYMHVICVNMYMHHICEARGCAIHIDAYLTYVRSKRQCDTYQRITPINLSTCQHITPINLSTYMRSKRQCDTYQRITQPNICMSYVWICISIRMCEARGSAIHINVSHQSIYQHVNRSHQSTYQPINLSTCHTYQHINISTHQYPTFKPINLSTYHTYQHITRINISTYHHINISIHMNRWI